MRLESLLRDALRARESGDCQRAATIAEQAEREGLVHPDFVRLRAEWLAISGRLPEAGELFNKALALDPRNPHTIADIGRVFVAEDRADESIDAFRAALSIRPDLVEVWLELGGAHELLKQDDEAAAAFRRAHQLAPSAPGPLAALATVALRRNNLEEALKLANRAMALQADHTVASFILAGVDLANREYVKVADRIGKMMASGKLDEHHALSAYAGMAEALEGLGRYAEAFEMYSKWNEGTRRTHAPKFGDGGRVMNHLEYMERMKSWFERQDPADWRRPWNSGDYVSPVRRHVFLFGYPRSGTTLLENILVSLPGVRGLEEKPTLSAADWEFLRDEPAMDQLTRLDPILADAQRTEYWQRVRRELPDVDGKTFVDMGPLNGIKLQVISRLFPDALLVRCRRDPRDVVLSCYKKPFRVNASTYQMTTLDGAARHFDMAMQLTELHLSVLPLPVHVVDYANLVADFDASTRALAEFIDVPWTEDVRSFDRTAAARPLRTASAVQVRRGLYDGTRQWPRYREQLAQVLPILEPWVTRFGYPL